MVTDVHMDVQALKYADASLQADKDVVMAAVTRYGWGLQYAAASLQADKQVVMAAVKNAHSVQERKVPRH